MAAAACTQRTALRSGVACSRSSRRVPAFTRSRAATVTVRAQTGTTSRRELVAGTAAALLAAVSLGAAPSAQAFLGFGEDAQKQEQYKSDTSAILASVNGALALEKDDPARDDKIAVVRKDINAWVAKYRRDAKFSGKPSYSNTYSAINALAGHYNSFGTQAPVPKKRLERLTKELNDAELLLSRDR